MSSVKIRKKAIVNQKECVACGCCVKVCPLGAISIFKGVFATVAYSKCIGCGKCASVCPASVIEMGEVI
ncbi:4Fe-4S binding protein [Anaeropeptidivorans aminofermentans]|jgi:Pyruvate/2-oxoacid:ferredoxin oxidoreductase delta subunit|uniref:4Fe-4S binding protein n=1 Tax=Anaeropeptidivorans aminofermentans TaxID=2934315 RepID=UPI002025A7C8|nr:4Fe-4S binding protein [Anaeropeptidivorans aminofermentans]MBE6012470.1 4Fe-4S dicluster domain-containing protein [Lachnospiraceae bacterium]